MSNFDKEISRINSQSLKWDVRRGELPMWVADMDFPTAPSVQNALYSRVKHGIFGYNIVPDKWYGSIINWWKRRHGLTIKRDSLIFATGVVPAVSSIVSRMTNVGDNIATLTPVYDIFFHSIENFGRHTMEIKLNYKDGKFSIDFDALERALMDRLTTMLILCNPHNPTGNIWSEEELKLIAELCCKYGVTVLSDEIHCDIIRPGLSYVPFLKVAGRCKTIVCVSASKAFNIAGLQSAAVIVPDPTVRSVVERGLNSNEVAEPNCFAVNATIAAFDEGEDWLNELVAYLFASRNVAGEFIKGIKGVKLIDSDATYLLWLDCREALGSSCSSKLNEHIRKTTGLVLSDGAQYRGGGENFLRMNIACPRARLRDGLNRLKQGIESFRS